MTSKLYNIPAGIPFAAALASGLLEQTGGDPQKLAACRVLLPTRRACRVLRDTFLRLTDGRPLLLPRLQPIGDVEEDELFLELAGQDLLDLPPALVPLRRQALLARTISRLPGYSRGPEQDFALARALGQLMDQVYTESLDLRDLPRLVKDRELAGHWQITVEFLKILSETWPAILAEQGVIDAADRRNRLIRALASHWQKNPPASPVIAAGSTGSIPATAALLRVIAGLPQGGVVLPGLDQDLDKDSWEQLDDTHPQATLRNLLGQLKAERTDVQSWPYALPAQDEPPALAGKKQALRRWLAGEMMRPAATADAWQTLSLPAGDRALLKESLGQIMRFECDTPQEEAILTALLMREALETKGRTAALITPDRTLARRVAMACRRWGIEVDDSAGMALRDAAIGSLLLLAAQVALNGARPGGVAALLKHPCCTLGRDKESFAALAGELETALLRGPAPGMGFAALYRKAASLDPVPDLTLLRELEALCAPLQKLAGQKLAGQPAPFSAFIDAHLALVESLARTPDENGAAILWQGDDGAAAAQLFAGLREQGDILPEIAAADYQGILEQLMRAQNVRSPTGVHPRLFILGQLEARLATADLIIMGGLNEKTWPPDSGSDPWMSRPMRADFGLPSPERGIGLAAHDFVQGFCADRVVLTRSRRVDGAPAGPARWLQRLDTVIEALGFKQQKVFSGHDYVRWARALDAPAGPPAPVGRPAPRPPAGKRPGSLSVTAIERWMRDPYAIYARYILRLKKLEDLEEDADAARRGTMMHAVLDRFIKEHPRDLLADAEGRLIALGREMLAEPLEEPRLWGFWWPRFERLAHWFVSHERQWRLTATPAKTEHEGAATLQIDGLPFTIRAKADRIDMTPGGGAVIDYKTGYSPSKKEVAAGFAPQLPLEAVILLEGGFPEIAADAIAYMGFWKMTGGAEPGGENEVTSDPEAARQGLAALVRKFRQESTPYYSLPRPRYAPREDFQHYAHLARVQEWAALDDSAEEAA